MVENSKISVKRSGPTLRTQHGDAVDKAFATVDLALAMYGTYHVAASTRSIPIREEAFAAAAAERLAAMRGGFTKGKAGVVLLNGDPFPGRSTTAGGRNMPIDPRVQQVLDSLQQISDYHGKCVEPRSVSGALGAGDPNGAWSAVVDISKGTRMDACVSCKQLLDAFGIRDANQPDYQPALWLIQAMFPNADSPR